MAHPTYGYYSASQFGAPQHYPPKRHPLRKVFIAIAVLPLTYAAGANFVRGWATELRFNLTTAPQTEAAASAYVQDLHAGHPDSAWGMTDDNFRTAQQKRGGRPEYKTYWTTNGTTMTTIPSTAHPQPDCKGGAWVPLTLHWGATGGDEEVWWDFRQIGGVWRLHATTPDSSDTMLNCSQHRVG